MDQFESRPGGVRKEVVTAYEPRGGGTVIPTAPWGTEGVRADLDANTILANPIDDPSIDEFLRGEPARLVSSPKQTGVQGKVQSSRPTLGPTKPAPQRSVAQGLAVPMPAVLPSRDNGAKAMPFASPEPGLPSLGLPPDAIQAAMMHEQTSRLERLETAVLSLVDGMNRRALDDLGSEMYDPPTLASPSVDTKPEPPDKPSYTPVVLEGSAFGRFRSKVRDVQFCDRHVALIYTDEAGDDDLSYEPPLGQAFLLKVPMEDRTYRDFLVAHFGLITRLEDRRMTIVVFPFAGEAPPESEEFSEQG